ncbi:MAG: hypothetical protein A2033_18565 [Bacteroidetes bacterium GWA2_31_9]|nr:MAG: hypothetical protein A2033_18565 [Bacteroidetes bacterium GWA2_31_9]
MDLLIQYHRNLLNNLRITFTRNIINEIEWHERLIGIEGYRGVGKTTLMLQYIAKNYSIDDANCLYVNLDNLYFPFQNLAELAQTFHNRGGKVLFIDEIHKYPDWSKELKHIYDMIPELKVVFSGSSIIHLQLVNADLSRRAVIYRMKNLSFREYLNIELKKDFKAYKLSDIVINHEKYTLEICSQIKPLQYFENYLKQGCFPFYLQGLTTYHQKLNSTLSLIIETEIPLISNIDTKNIILIKRLLQYLSAMVPLTVNISKIAVTFGLSRQTVISILKYLNDTEIISSIYSSGSLYRKMAKPEKIYLGNPNLCYSLSSEKPEVGNLRETFFVNQLQSNYTIEIPEKGDFLIDNKYTFEIGGKSKTNEQIKNIKQSYIVADNIEYGIGNKIPLWLFGFLY